jgi:hypothetical protein
LRRFCLRSIFAVEKQVLFLTECKNNRLFWAKIKNVQKFEKEQKTDLKIMIVNYLDNFKGRKSES